MEVSQLPTTIKDQLDQNGYGHVLDDPDQVLRKESSKDIVFRNLVIIPGHYHDIRESNIALLATDNLKEVGVSSVMRAPFAKIFEKIDPSKPAWVVMEGSNLEAFYYSF